MDDQEHLVGNVLEVARLDPQPPEQPENVGMRGAVDLLEGRPHGLGRRPWRGAWGC